MIINKVVGKMSAIQNPQHFTIERLILTWDELHKKVMRKTTDVGRDIGLQLDGGHLHPGDILFREGMHLIIVEVKEESVMVVPVGNMHEMGLAAHAVGNMHAPIQVLDDKIVTPYNSVLYEQLGKLGLNPYKEERAFAP
jgi:urease accessory protein